MENLKTPLTVSKENFNEKYIKNLKDTKKLKIEGNYTLTKKDYDNLIVYSNITEIEVYDIEDFNYGNEIKINLKNKITFKSEKYKKYNVDKINGYDKQILTINLPFNIYFTNDCLYSEEEDFNKLLKYIKKIETLNIKFDNQNIDEIIKTVYKIENKIETKIPFINIITNNQTIKEIEKLHFLEDNRIIKIWYEDGISDCTINEFITMRKNIDNIVNKIKKANLSPFESTIYAYDIVKKYNYNKSDDTYSMDGRQLHKIFTTNNIVCSGYSRIISQVLNELNIKSGIYKLKTKNTLHARCLVHIKDEKYNINTICSMEPTWESNIKEDYAYSLFLTPINKLKQSFPNDTFKEDIDVLTGNKKIEEISLKDKISLYKFFNDKDLNQSTIDKLINEANKDITIDKFFKALVNVRTKQGYSKQLVTANLENILNYNRQLTNYLNNKIGTNINFF